MRNWREATSMNDFPGDFRIPDAAKHVGTIQVDFMKDRHKRAAKSLGYALTMADPKKWASTAIIWEARLDTSERYQLARSVMLAMRPEDIEALVSDVLGGTGCPPPPFLAPLDDAHWWSALASPAERRAFCLAAFLAMSKREQRSFLAFAEGVTK
jgi:hypothetical protein